MALNRRWVSLVWISAAIFLGSFVSYGAQVRPGHEPLGPSSRTTGLVISEIMYNPLPVPGVSTNLTHEYIELFNTKPWAENIGGYAIGGDVSFVFPPETILGPSEFLVVARVPEMLSTNYAISNVWGPWVGASSNRLSVEQGMVQLLNRQGAVLLEVNYQDSPPWPESADGAGHSLNLSRPSYGEDDFRAWSQSDSLGGSPGRPDPYTPDPLAAIFINEWQNHSDPLDWLELYNHGNVPLDLSGAYLSDSAVSNFYRIPDGTVIPARGFRSWDQNQLGFELFAGGETIYFWSTNRARVIDVIDFRGQSNNITSGRAPDGGPIQYGLAIPTRNQPNSAPMRYGVVINEIMYNPVSGSNDDEYLEIHNRRNTPANISGWEFVTGIGFVFPTNALTLNMPPNAYWVLARNPTNLMRIYPHLTTNNTFGPYTGTLANGGERVVFTAADYDIVGGFVEKLAIPISDVNYGDGGKWGFWSDGDGSSLELIDPDADVHHPSNWADSDDVAESRWTAIEMEVPPGETLGSPVNDSLIIGLLGVGECLIDEIEVRADDGPNLVVNGGFESGLSGWSLQGSFDMSTVANTGFAGQRSLHVRAGSRGDNQSNRILSPPFIQPVPPQTKVVSIRVKAKWLRGSPEILLRLHGSATEAYGRMYMPRALGTPGMPNSRFMANNGPAVYDVKHAPVLPATGAPAVITARATDPEGVATLTVRYRLDPSPTYTDLTMVDNGTNGDEVEGDGLYSATIPGQAEGVMVAFYVEARDGGNAIGTFPHRVFPGGGLPRTWPGDAVAREAVIRWGEVQMPGDFATYHLWVTAVNSNRWHHRDPMNNNELDGTFVYNNSRVVYNALPLFSGSPWHRTNSTAGPAGLYRVDYEMNFPDDEPLLGATDFVLNNPGNPDILTISDLSAVGEQTVYHIFEGLGLPHNHRRYVHFFVNGNQRSTAHERPGNFIFEDSQQPNGDMIEQWFPNDPGGQLFKVEDWFEFERNGFDPAAFNDADLERRTVLIDGEETFLPAPYRFMYRKRSVGVGGSANDFSAIYALVDAVSPAGDAPTNTIDPERLATVVDWEAWMRHFAVQRAVGNWDSFGWERGKNDYLYQTAGGFVHMPWDIDYSLGLGRGPTEPLMASNDRRIAAMFNTPEIVRAYWRAFHDLVTGPFSNEYLDPLIDVRVNALLANEVNIDPDAVARIKSYIEQRRAFLEEQLAMLAVPFGVEEPLAFLTNNNLLVLHGSAPVAVKEITINGEVYPVNWTSVTNFVLRFVLQPGANQIVVGGIDRLGSAVFGASLALEVTYTGPVVDPAGALIISEIMAQPATPGGQFIEIQNLSGVSFSLSGWRLEGVNYTFPFGSILTNGEIIVLAQNGPVFNSLYPAMRSVGIFGRQLAPNGEAIALWKSSPVGDALVDAVRYEAGAPWPEAVSGHALQLIDVSQDNSRPSNWTLDSTQPATPGRSNSVAGMIQPFDDLWLNEIQSDNLSGPRDNQNEAEPWVELLNSGTETISLNGYYLTRDFATNLLEWPFPPGLSLAPGEHRLIWADGEPGETTVSAVHTSFRLSYSGRLGLVRLVNGQPEIVDYLRWPDVGTDAAYGSYPDGQLVYRYELSQPTPAATNRYSNPPITVNEWLARRDNSGLRDPADNDFDDWFELYNSGSQSVDLGGFFLTDQIGQPAKFMIPDNGRYVIPAGGFLLVWADDEPAQNAANRADLHVNFRLGGDSGYIGLSAPETTNRVNEVSYGPQAEEISEGRFTDGASAIQVLRRLTPRGPNASLTGNVPPVYPSFFPRQVLPPGGRATITSFLPTDPDVPPQTLSYSYQPVLEGTGINATGQFRWIVPSNQPPGDYVFTLYATDDGTPPRTGAGILNFTITGDVVVPPGTTPQPEFRRVVLASGEASILLETIPGVSYRVVYADNLASSPITWHQLGSDFVAASDIASISDPEDRPQRFYRLVRLD